MQSRIRTLLCLALLALIATPALADGTRVLKVDPVLLVEDGRVVPGSETLTLEWGIHRYRFAAAENRAKFIATPERYEIQLGGSCARMGPLSGEGSADIYAVHDGRIYIFASEECRNTFRADPESLLESDDPVPPLETVSLRRGRELLDMALKSIGGAKAADATKSVVERDARKVTHGDNPYNVARTRSVGYPGTLLRTEAWNDDSWGVAVVGDEAFMFSGDKRRPLVASQRRAFEKEMGRNLLSVLRNRKERGVVIAHMGTGDVLGHEVELVAVALDGATTTVAIDGRTGRVLALRYRGRGPDAKFGDIEERLSSFQRVGKVLLPTTRKVYFNGEEAPSLSVERAVVETDLPVRAAALAGKVPERKQ